MNTESEPRTTEPLVSFQPRLPVEAGNYLDPRSVTFVVLGIVLHDPDDAYGDAYGDARYEGPSLGGIPSQLSISLEEEGRFRYFLSGWQGRLVLYRREDGDELLFTTEEHFAGRDERGMRRFTHVERTRNAD